MKKVFIFGILGLFLMQFASSYGGYGGGAASGLEYGMQQLIDMVEGLLGPLVSIFLGGSGDLLFERILFFIIVFSIVYVVISRTPIFEDKKPIIWIISIAVSLLATRYLMESEIIQTMILPYSVLGVSISAIIPFLIYFYFVESFRDSAVVRKLLWVFFVIIFIGLWMGRYDEVGELSWIYFFTALFAFLFLLFDGTIQKYFILKERKERDIESKEEHLAKLRKELEDLRNNSKYYSPVVFKRLEKKLMKRIADVQKAPY